MERTRDVSPKSIASSVVKSVSSTSMNSQSSDKKNVKNCVEDQSSMLPLILEAINETIAEKNARGKEIYEFLNLLDINVKSLPKDIQELWAKTAAIMRTEGLSSMDEVTLTLHMEHKKKEAIKKARKERKLKARYNELQDCQMDVLEKNNRAQESIDLLQKIVDDESTDDRRHVNRMVNAVKLNDYKQVIEKTEESLTELGANDYLPQRILDKYKIYLELKEDLKKMDDSLSKYCDLPPNLSEARVKLAEKEKYLKDLEHAMFEKMK